MDINEQERIDAVNRYIKGDKPADIYRDANRSKKWLTGWVDRFKTGEEEWYRSRSRAPKKHGRKTNEEIERAIVSIRKALIEGNEHESKYLGVGADAIQYRMNELGFSEDEMPSASTIKRIVKKHGLKVNKRERYKAGSNPKSDTHSLTPHKSMRCTRWTLLDRDSSRDMAPSPPSISSMWSPLGFILSNSAPNIWIM